MQLPRIFLAGVLDAGLISAGLAQPSTIQSSTMLASTAFSSVPAASVYTSGTTRLSSSVDEKTETPDVLTWEKDVEPVTDYVEGQKLVCDDKRKLAIAVLARPNAGFAQSAVWENWYKEADSWGLKHGCQSTPVQVFVNTMNFNGQGWVKVIKKEEEASIVTNEPLGFELYPKWVTPVKPVDCEWGRLLPCEHNLLSKTLALTDDTTQWIALVSEDSIPLRPASEMLGSLYRRNTTRLFVGDPAFSTAKDFPHAGAVPVVCPKHHQWLVLRRDHLQALDERPEEWTEVDWATADYPTSEMAFAASDEWAPGCAILARVGAERFGKEVNRGNGWPAWRSGAPPMRVCWHDCFTQGECDSGRRPCVFTVFYESALAEATRPGGSWFMRKVANDTVVRPDSESSPLHDIPLKNYLTFSA